MNMTKTVKRKIVADSAGDIHFLEGVDFGVVPLKIVTAERQYTDDNTLNAEQMAANMQSYKGRSSTSCPNTEDWLSAFGDADEIFCVTITATLSGSYNSAMISKREYEEAHPDRRVFVLNSLSTGPEMVLIIERIRALIEANESFDSICEKIEKYRQSTALLFVLESLKNLANNGRVSPIVAKMAGILGIRLVGKASDRGDLEPLSKCRGERKALEATFEHMLSMGYSGGKTRIGHCVNPESAKVLRSIITAKFPQADICIYKLGGLCSFYAEKGGVLIGFEKNIG